MHVPLNHSLRTPYRYLAGLTGLYLLLAGGIGLAGTLGDPIFHRGGHWALGMQMNTAGALVVLLLGLIVLAAAVIGGNVHHRVNQVTGWAIAAYSMVVLAVIRTDVNVVDVSIVNVMVLATLGSLVLTAALYGRVGEPEPEPDVPPYRPYD